MKRRTFFKLLFGGLGAAVVAPALGAEGRRVLIQKSPIAGFQFHSGEDVWPWLRVGQALELVRESWNIHDSNAIAVYYRGAQIGYVPRAENSAVARMMDRGERIEANIVELFDDENPWNRIHIGISLVHS
jgi:hypothetical protein